MDWGCVGQMNVAMAVWGAMCSAETELWNDDLDDLLALFVDEFHAMRRTPGLDVARLRDQVVLYAAVMAMTWLLDVPCLRHQAGGRPRLGGDPNGSRHPGRRKRAMPTADDGQRAQPMGDKRRRRRYSPRSQRVAFLRPPIAGAVPMTPSSSSAAISSSVTPELAQQLRGCAHRAAVRGAMERSGPLASRIGSVLCGAATFTGCPTLSKNPR